MSLDVRSIQKVVSVGEHATATLQSGLQFSGIISEIALNHLIVGGTLISLQNLAAIHSLPEDSTAESRPTNPESPVVVASVTEEIQEAVALSAERLPLEEDQGGTIDTTPETVSVEQSVAVIEETPIEITEEIDSDAPANLTEEHSPQAGPKETEEICDEGGTTVSAELPEEQNDIASDHDIQSQKPEKATLYYYLQKVQQVKSATDSVKIPFPSLPSHIDDLRSLKDKELLLSIRLSSIWDSYDNAPKVKNGGPSYRHCQNFLKEIETLLKDAPSHPILLKHTIYFAMIAKEYAKAKHYLFRTLLVEESATLWLQLGWCYFTTGKYSNALGALASAFKLASPKDHEAYWWGFIALLRQENALEELPFLVKHVVPVVDDLLFASILFWCFEKPNEALALKLTRAHLDNILTFDEIISQTDTYRSNKVCLLSDSFQTLNAELERYKNLSESQLLAEDLDPVRKGTLQSYNKNKRTGIIQDSITKEKLPFKFTDIVDIKLYHHMLSGGLHGEYAPDLCFLIQKSNGAQVAAELTSSPKPKHAIGERLYKKISSEAIAYAENKEFNFSLNRLSMLMKHFPQDATLKSLQEKWKLEWTRVSQPKTPVATNTSLHEALKPSVSIDNSVFAKAEAYAQENNFDKALELLNKQSHYFDDKAKGINFRLNMLMRAGKFFFSQHDYQKAEHIYRQACSLQKANFGAHKKVAVCMAYQGKAAEAKSYLAPFINDPQGAFLKDLYDSLTNPFLFQLNAHHDSYIVKMGSNYFRTFVARAESEGYSNEHYNEQSFSEDDLQQLHKKISALDPTDLIKRAALLLTCGRISYYCMKDSVRANLYGAAAYRDRGRHSLLEGVEKDITLAWYSEAFFSYDRCNTIWNTLKDSAFPFIDDSTTPEKTLSSIMLIACDMPLNSESMGLATTLDTLAQSFAQNSSNETVQANKLLKLLVWLNAHSKIFGQYFDVFLEHAKWRQHIVSYCIENKVIHTIIPTEEDLQKGWEQLAMKRLQDNRLLYETFGTLLAPELSEDWLSSAMKCVQSIENFLFFDTDHAYLRNYNKLLEKTQQLLQDNPLEEHWLHCSNALELAEQLQSNLMEAPTKFGLELLWRAVERLRVSLLRSKASLLQKKTPLLTSGLATTTAHLHADTRQATIYIAIENEAEWTSVEAIHLHHSCASVIFPSDDNSVLALDSLPGGKSQTLAFSFPLPESAMQQPEVELVFFLSYTWKIHHETLEGRTDDLHLSIALPAIDRTPTAQNSKSSAVKGMFQRVSSMISGSSSDSSFPTEASITLCENPDAFSLSPSHATGLVQPLKACDSSETKTIPVQVEMDRVEEKREKIIPAPFQKMQKAAFSASTFKIYIDEAWVGTVPNAVKPINQGVIAGVVWFGEKVNPSILPSIPNHLRTTSLPRLKQSLAMLLECPHCFPFIMPITVSRDGEPAQRFYSKLIHTCIKVLLGWMLPKYANGKKKIEIYFERISEYADNTDYTQYLIGHLDETRERMPRRFQNWQLTKALFVDKCFEYVPYADLLAYLSHDHTEKVLALGEFSKYKDLPGYLPISTSLFHQLEDIERLEELGNVHQVLDFISNTHGTRLGRKILDDLKGRFYTNKGLQEKLLRALEERYQKKDRNLFQLRLLFNAVIKLVSDDISQMPKQMQLLHCALHLQRANHHGDPEMALQTRKQYQVLREEIRACDRELAACVDLNVSVSYADSFQFEEAARCVDAVLQDPLFGALSPLMRGQSHSARGQYHAMLGKDQEAESCFEKALTLFELTDLTASDRESETLQTGIYRAINAMDASLPNAKQLIEKITPLNKKEIYQLSSDSSHKNQYRHHLLVRALYWIRDYKSLQDCYLSEKLFWGYSLQHPWELISLYRGLIIMEKQHPSAKKQAMKQFTLALDICKSEIHGATLQLIGAMIATAAYCSTQEKEYYDEAQTLLTTLDQSIPNAAHAIARFRTALASPAPEQIRPVLKTLPFNYH